MRVDHCYWVIKCDTSPLINLLLSDFLGAVNERGTDGILLFVLFLSPSQTIMDVIVSNVTLVDNGLGIMSLIFAPPSLSHAYADKTVHIQVRRVYLDPLSSLTYHM